MIQNIDYMLLIGIPIIIVTALLSYLLTRIHFQNKISKLKYIHSSFEKEKFNEISNLKQEITIKESELKNIASQWKKDIERWEEKWQEEQKRLKEKEEIFRKEFENLANKILEDKSRKFTQQNKENLDQILNPFKEKMEEFKQKVERVDKDSFGRHKEMKEQLNQLKDMNQRLSQDAINLTKALKGDSKTQGIWGEAILNSLLEKSGLEKGREYFVQESYKANDHEDRQRLQPDVIIHLPDNKRMIIDSKVSLSAYERYINSEDKDEESNNIKQHHISVKTHINELSKKRYEDLLEGLTPEFVLMFIPVEPAFSLAIREEPSLYNTAFEKNIVIVTPSTLLATLKIVDSMWQNEKQRQNAFEIAKEAGALYDKFHGLIEDLINMGNKLDKARDSYNDVMNKLSKGRGNLIKKVENLKTLGAKAKKQLPEKI